MSSKPLSRTEYRILVEQAPIMIWRANTTAECDYFNDRWLQFRGRPLEQECGNQWTEGVHREELNRCLATYREAFEKREPFEMEYRLQRHDGDIGGSSTQERRFLARAENSADTSAVASM